MSPETFILALVAVFAGALVQGAVGFGFSLTAVPTLALVRPEAVPVTLLLVALPGCVPLTHAPVSEITGQLIFQKMAELAR